ncbi:MAG: hemerythrin domain-containing protein [Sulfobacillus sp.]
MDLIAQLIAEHQEFVHLLTHLAETVDAVKANGRGNYFVATLDSLMLPLTKELDDHALREEKFLFPRIVERGDTTQVILQMVEEHGAIRGESAAFERHYGEWKAGDDQALPLWTAHAIELRGKFSAHMQKENLIVFPMARRILTADELAHLAE